MNWAPASSRGCRSTEKSRDSVKGRQWYFGLKLPSGIDRETGLVHSLVTTPVHGHDLRWRRVAWEATASAPITVPGKHPCHVIKCLFGFRKVGRA